MKWTSTAGHAKERAGMKKKFKVTMEMKEHMSVTVLADSAEDAAAMAEVRFRGFETTDVEDANELEEADV